MRKAAVRHPIFSSIIVVALFIASMYLSSFFLMFSNPIFRANGEFLMQLVAESLLSLIGLLLMLIFGYVKVWNSTENFGSGLLSGGYFIVISLISLSSTVIYELGARGSGFFSQMVPLWKILVFAATMFTIGFCEEMFFRGIISNLFWDKHAKDPAGVWTATIYSGLIFGLMHGINFQAAIASGVLVQMLAAAAMGMALTAIYYRCRNLWVTVCLHAFLDFCALFSEGFFGGTISEAIGGYTPLQAITSTVPYIIVTLVLLRRRKLAEMFADKSTLDALRNDRSLIMTVNFATNLKSRKSLDRAIIVFIICAVMLFFGSVALSPDFDAQLSGAFGDIFGESTLDVTHSGAWEGEDVFGYRAIFEIDKFGNYTVTVKSQPSDSDSYVFVPINDSDGEAVYEENYGGTCIVTFSLELEAGEYELNLVYDYSRVRDPDAEYNTHVTIQ